MIRNFTLSVVAEYRTNIMKFIYVSLVVLSCVVIEIRSQRIRNGMCKSCQHEEYIRIKRAKYYSSPPLRFYNRPPMSYPIKGAFSYTPPPGYITDDSRQNKNLNSKVSSNIRPTNEGIGDEDLNSIMRFLSKQDLDKIVEFANEGGRDPPKSSESYDRPSYIGNEAEKYENKVIYNGNSLEFDNDSKYSNHGSFIRGQENYRPYDDEYNNPNVNEIKDPKPFRFLELEPSALFINKNNLEFNAHDDSDRGVQNQHLSTLKAYHTEVNENRYIANSFNDNISMQEEQLPKPSNLRDDDFEVSYTNNVPKVVKANSNTYKVENLGALPLMNYHSKLDTVDSYRVPHYTVTSPEKYRAPASSAKVSVEPAPPASTAQQQSDAHLKAIKIWTHKSKGTAYTLHDDGTLSLERPSQPKTNYAHP